MCVVWQITVQALRWQCALLASKLLDKNLRRCLLLLFSVRFTGVGFSAEKPPQKKTSLAMTTNPAKRILTVGVSRANWEMISSQCAWVFLWFIFQTDRHTQRPIQGKRSQTFEPDFFSPPRPTLFNEVQQDFHWAAPGSPSSPAYF